MENANSHEDRQSNNVDVNNGNSTENFQKFVYELFEKNGVLNDLRAYLRGHIINVLKSVHTGESHMSQKHFTQRLELTFQAINMLIVEYLLCMDFNYSLSVFITEIPLANMVFDLAKSLLESGNDNSIKGLRFQDSDVWCILNCLGIKCDSESASDVIDMYKKEQHTSLLLCILKCILLYQKQAKYFEEVNTSEVSIASSGSYPVSKQRKSVSYSCKHHAFCKGCQLRTKTIQRKYKRKKLQIYKSVKRTSKSKGSAENFLKNMDVMERSIMDEMFEQLKTVYETEVEMVRAEEEKKIKRTLANHALLLQKRYNEMEESFKAREAELENNVQEKKKFLWGLARSLREQHSNMSNAMKAVKRETERLTAKEESLKQQILEAEQTLKKRGDEMQSQISNELIILEGHLNSMKRERDMIEREKSELKKLKELCDSNTKINTDYVKEREELHSHCDLLRDQLLMLKEFMASTKLEPKCVIERGVMTDARPIYNITMNNDQELERNVKSDDGIRTPNQVINDLRKPKTVNFDQRKSFRNETAIEVAAASFSSEASEERDLMLLLREENKRLMAFSEQQREHIDELAREQVRLRSELAASRLASPRPRTAPAVMPTSNFCTLQGDRRNSMGLRKGAGEEVSLFDTAQPHILRPGDVLPFVGVLTDRHADSRRHLVNQWRSLRRRFSPHRGLNQRPTPVSPHAGTSRKDDVQEASPAVESISPQPKISANDQFLNSLINENNRKATSHPEPTLETNKTREKSPKYVLREAKQKLRNKESVRHQTSVTLREKSPNSMLREAKLRLRKLEIEAEAVEKSYMDFRRRRSEANNEDLRLTTDKALDEIDQNLYLQYNSSFHKQHKNINTKDENKYVEVTKEALKKDFDKYLRNYQTKYNFMEHFANKNTTAVRVKPIPNSYFNLDKELDDGNRIQNNSKIQNVNYLEAPLTEFRKLYHNPKPLKQVRTDNSKSKSPIIDRYEIKQNKTENTQFRTPSDICIDRNAEIISYPEIKERAELKECTENKMVDSKTKEHINETSVTTDDDLSAKQIHDDLNLNSNRNILKVEVESVTQTRNIKTLDSQDNLMIIVESSIDTKELITSQDDITKHAPMTIVLSPKINSPRKPVDIELDKNIIINEIKDLSLAEHSARTIKSKSPDESIKSPRTEEFLTRLNENYEEQSPDKFITSPSPEPAAHHPKNDALNAIFQTEPAKDASSINIGLVNSEDGLESLNKTDEYQKDYSDNFSADVDNYNSHSMLDNSPISLPKTSEDDNFWD
ncbi:unnamed protein product [Parnassius apollo]|uniref:(apollo) hypothetical protein n=1 Tax=Parnassius apollo TaxID=110799 RepID=A0A8S3W399_PARAO|nr:unnamed protein product [Parnassius apollo]